MCASVCVHRDRLDGERDRRGACSKSSKINSQKREFRHALIRCKHVSRRVNVKDGDQIHEIALLFTYEKIYTAPSKYP